MSDCSANGSDSYDEFVESIRTGRHPAYGTLVWDGQTRQTAFTIQFRRNENDDPDMVRLRAWRTLKKIGAGERHILKIEVAIKQGLPVYATIQPRDEAAGVLRLGTARLQALEAAANR